MDKRQITLRETVAVADTEGYDLVVGKAAPGNRLLKHVGNFLRLYSSQDSAASWYSGNGETVAHFSLASVTEREADLISDRLDEMGAAHDVNLFGASFAEATRRALGGDVGLLQIDEKQSCE